MNTISPGDRERARRLPDEFSSAAGSAEQRVEKIVRHSWPNYPRPVRAGIAEGLLPVLAPLMDQPGPPPEAVRAACEAVVSEWTARFR